MLESGDGVTSCVPIYKGYAIQHAASRIDIGGRDITEHLILLLRKAGHILHTSVFNFNNLKIHILVWVWNSKEDEGKSLSFKCRW